ncbi:MAG TPA: GspE/PulE family protein [Candidatus Paceibacterota bacterium]
MDDAKIKEILLRENYVTAEDVQKAEAAAQKEHTSIVDYFLAHDLLTKDLLGQAIAESLEMPYADLNSAPPSPEQLARIPEDLAKKYRVVLFEEKPREVTIATDIPITREFADAMKGVFPGKEIFVSYALSEFVDEALGRYRKPLATRFSKIIEGEQRVAPEIIEQVFSDALMFRASDIHFEPREGEVVVRFRVDGVLQEAGRIPKEHYENILNRIKVQSHLRIDEHVAAQDGSLHYENTEAAADLRVSIVPTVEGEKVVLRVLAAYVQGFSLADLGLTDEHEALIRAAADKPFGMILTTGPTGAGKTTTLYALLKLLNQPDVNITTIEDPVEYKMQGVNQIQVSTLANLTFASGLRSIVRQDPDIILVGEIRDNETAEIAVNAALTGHLLLSTFHANDAATAIPRLLEMGIEPFLLASTLELVVAQRLARKICERCRYSTTVPTDTIPLPARVRKEFFDKKEVTLYQGKGCDACAYTGYKGRTAFFEFISVTPELQELILKRPSTQEIAHLARTQGSRSLFEDGIEKVKEGVTTLEELLRVAEIPKALEK